MNEKKYSANKGKKNDDFQIILYKIMKKNVLKFSGMKRNNSDTNRRKIIQWALKFDR